MHATHKIFQLEQCPGPSRPTGKLLAFFMDEFHAEDEIAGISINGQTGKLLIAVYVGGGKKEVHEYNFIGRDSDSLK